MKIPLLSRFFPGKAAREAEAEAMPGPLDGSGFDDTPLDDPPLSDPPLADMADDEPALMPSSLDEPAAESPPEFDMPDFDMLDPDRGSDAESGEPQGRRYLLFALIGILVLAVVGGAGYFAVKRGVVQAIAKLFVDRTMIAMPMPPMPPGADLSAADEDYDAKMEGPVRVRPPPPPPKPVTVEPPSADTVLGRANPTIPADEPEEKPKAVEPPPPPAPAAPPSVVTSAPPPPPMTEPLTPPPGDPLAAPAYVKLPSREDLKALPPAPIPALLRNSERGPLPIIAGGREPRTAYARPFNPQPGKPMIAIVVTGLGLQKDAADAAINKLPPEISLSFSAYSNSVDSWIKSARSRGHETLLDMPLEPPNFPTRDSGPFSILSGDSPAQAVAKLETLLGKSTSYVGLAGTLRSPVTATETWGPLLRTLRDRGLLFVGDGLTGVSENLVPASAEPTLVADDTPFRAAIDVKLARALAAAQRDGFAVVFVTARPVTFERLLAWVATFPQRNVTLAPVSALVQLRAQ